MQFDWKFFVTLAIAIAGVAAPVWIWQADLSSKALSLTVKSTVELQPKGVDKLDGIQLLVDGKSLDSPYVSVLELSNSGSKPIVTSDFEGPVRISTASPSSLLKVRTTSPTPLSLEPSVSLAEGVISLQPLLLNPGDTIRIIVVAGNSKPMFAARARVAGVAEINIVDEQVGRDTKSLWLGRCVTVLLLTLYIVNMTEFSVAGLQRRTFLPTSLVTGITSGIGGVLLFSLQSPESAAAPSRILLVTSIAALLSLPVFFWRERRLWAERVAAHSPVKRRT